MFVKGFVKNPVSLVRLQREIRTLLNLSQNQIPHPVTMMTFSTTQDMMTNLMTVSKVDIQHGIAAHLRTFQNNIRSITEALI